MQGLLREHEQIRVLGSKASRGEAQVIEFVQAVELIADDRETQRVESGPDLMGPARYGKGSQ
jgi:hypothetical protein